MAKGLNVDFWFKWVRDDREEKQIVGFDLYETCNVLLHVEINAVVISSLKARGEIWTGDNQVEFKSF